MTIEEAIKILETAQKMLQPILENWRDLTSDEEFQDGIGAAINLINMSAEDLSEGLEEQEDEA